MNDMPMLITKVSMHDAWLVAIYLAADFTLIAL